MTPATLKEIQGRHAETSKSCVLRGSKSSLGPAEYQIHTDRSTLIEAVEKFAALDRAYDELVDALWDYGRGGMDGKGMLKGRDNVQRYLDRMNAARNGLAEFLDDE